MRKDFDFCTADQQSIARRFAYVYKDGGHPIHCVEDIQQLASKNLLPQKTVHWQIPDAEWQSWIDQQWWGKNNSSSQDVEYDLQMLVLRAKLLSFGGAEACLPISDEDLPWIMEYGQLWWGDRLKYMKGKPSCCHENSSLLYAANKARNLPGHSSRQNITIATGYALSPDGMWRQHSWCLLRTARSVTVVETTVKRLLYFGYAMTEVQAEQFEYDNT